MSTPDLSWRDLKVMVTQAQPGTATYKALNPHWRATDEVELLRSTEYSLRWLRWAKTRAAKDGHGEPKPHYWPWERERMARDNGFRGDELTWEDVVAMLEPRRDPDVDQHRAFPDEKE